MYTDFQNFKLDYMANFHYTTVYVCRENIIALLIPEGWHDEIVILDLVPNVQTLSSLKLSSE